MLRRFETYGFAAHAGADERTALADVLRSTGRHIPEVLDSAVGHNRSDVDVDLVWEHAYEDADAYACYMHHPFHICVLDRYLLPENPECITAPRGHLQLGLLGYEVAGAPFRASAGVRRIVALRMRPGCPAADVATLLGRLEARRDEVPGLVVSVAAANTMGLEWFPAGWTHVWEQAFVSEEAMEAAAAGEAALLAVDPVQASVDLWYVIEPGPGGGAPDAAIPPSSDWPRVLMVDAVAVDPADADAYLEAFGRLYLPGARARGLELVATWRTPGDIGEAVTVTTVLDVGSWSDWEAARNAAVGDPAVAEWIAFRRGVMRHGTRRFVAAASG